MIKGFSKLIQRKRIIITGRVQGVGFRPAVYRIATSLALTGNARNDTRGVTIELQGSPERIDAFIERLKGPDKPPLAKIKSCRAEQINIVENEDKFRIASSDPSGQAVSEVTADMATCSDCLREMNDQTDFRSRYPFINCTNCGPRYSIVRTIPYDRPNTTMSVFPMCPKCQSQYKDISDRRFHAQPVACPDCGPNIYLTDSRGKIDENDSDAAVKVTAQTIADGKIAAVKGLGGFHLAVNALDSAAVARLRERKKRDHKPFALMAACIDKIKQFAHVSLEAEEVLKSPESPIVILPKLNDCSIAPGVADGINTLGFMLCYTPLHFLLFAEPEIEVLVMTSGNISDEPLICGNQKALDRLGSLADVFLMHNRDIYRQVDDSIVHIVDGQPIPLRRARGFVPTPIILSKNNTTNKTTNSSHPCPEILAAGSDLKNTFCLFKADKFIPSEHIGDLEDAEVYHHFLDSIQHLSGLYEFKPEIIACDLHPGYFSTRWAINQSDAEILQVQHHWAHIASVLSEHNIEGPVIGIECDGTGYGTDRAIWGCECMIADLDNFERFGHLAYYDLPGGDKASKEAIRSVLGILYHAYDGKIDIDDLGWLTDRIEPDREKIKLILEQIEKQLNTAKTSSLGRIFDAVAAITGLGNYNHYEAQLPMMLESAIQHRCDDAYSCQIQTPQAKPVQLNLDNMFHELIEDVRADTPTPIMAAKFHNCIARGLQIMARAAREKSDLSVAALSGGVFCNRYLLNRLKNLLKQDGFEVVYNVQVPSNDGGISLGQAAIAAKRFADRSAKEL
jgi:hydrogenase maturation protein HypF